jgi:hypothetical protein
VLVERFPASHDATSLRIHVAHGANVRHKHFGRTAWGSASRRARLQRHATPTLLPRAAASCVALRYAITVTTACSRCVDVLWRWRVLLSASPPACTWGKGGGCMLAFCGLKPLLTRCPPSNTELH